LKPYEVIMPLSILFFFKYFMLSHDIPHQTSCAYTPRQNGMVESKNRHLVETTRTLLIYGEVAQCFCDNVVLSA